MSYNVGILSYVLGILSNEFCLMNFVLPLLKYVLCLLCTYLTHLRKPWVLSPLRSLREEVDLVPLACEDVRKERRRLNTLGLQR